MSNTSSIIRSGKLFPFQFQYFGILLIIISVLLLIDYVYLAPVPLLPGIMMVTAWHGVELVPTEGKYRAFNSFILFKTGTWRSYDILEKLYITESFRTQKVYMLVTSGPTIRKKYYNGYLKFEDGTKLLLISRKSKPMVLDRLKKFNRHLKLEISDYTG